LQVINDDDNNNKTKNNTNRESESIAISRHTTPVDFAFMSIRSPTTKKQYPRRLKQFFDYMSLEGNTLEEQAQTFLAGAKKEQEYWVDGETRNSPLPFFFANVGQLFVQR
jgi:hypothetical protein